MTTLIPVPFYDDTLWADEVDPKHPVAVKPIVENIGVDWEGQRQRIRRDAILNEGTCIIQVPSPGGMQETVCLTMDLIPGFLFGIDDRRIADPIKREKVLRYKRKCYRVLYDHFNGAASAATDPATHEGAITEEKYVHDEHTFDGPLQTINSKARLVEIAERISGKAAARALWADLGLPALQPDLGRGGSDFSLPDDAVAIFAREGIERADGLMLPASAILPAFKAFVKARGMAWHESDQTFATRFGRMGFAKRKINGRIVYVNIRPKAPAQEGAS